MRIQVNTKDPAMRTNEEVEAAEKLAREIISKVIKEKDLTIRELKTLGIVFPEEARNEVERQMSLQKTR